MTPKEIVDMITQITLQDIAPLTLLIFQLRIAEKYFKVIERTEKDILNEVIERNKNENE